MNVKELAKRINAELFGIAEEDLTKAEKNILKIIVPFIDKKENI